MPVVGTEDVGLKDDRGVGFDVDVNVGKGMNGCVRTRNTKHTKSRLCCEAYNTSSKHFSFRYSKQSTSVGCDSNNDNTVTTSSIATAKPITIRVSNGKTVLSSRKAFSDRVKSVRLTVWATAHCSPRATFFAQSPCSLFRISISLDCDLNIHSKTCR